MRLATVEQCREMDRLSVKKYGLAGDTLMEAAGVMAARELEQNFYPELTRGRTVIVCGPGNNGADGLVVARHLHSAGFRDLLIVRSSGKMSPLFQVQLKRAQKHGLRVVADDELNQLDSAVLIVDALFGLGFKGKPEGRFLRAIEKINACKVPVVSLDVPSGLDCDTGNANGVVVQAHTTFTFGLAKPGFFVADGPAYSGKIRVLPIGYPYELVRSTALTHFLFNEKLARRYLPERKSRTNKSDYGRLVVMAGRQDTWGAGVLCAQSAYRMGAGYVIWAGHDLPIEKLEQTPEVLTAKLEDARVWDKSVTAYAVGPGLGADAETLDIVRRLRRERAARVVLDADAITVCARELYESSALIGREGKRKSSERSASRIFPLPESWVVTPHAGELARLLRMTPHEIENDRFAAALKAAQILGCHVLLKGYRPVLAYKDRCLIIGAGNSALAKAGSGDVLTGMIGSLLAQGLDTVQATATATYIHGRLADEWVRTGHDKRTLNPSDLKDSLGQLIAQVVQS